MRVVDHFREWGVRAMVGRAGDGPCTITWLGAVGAVGGFCAGWVAGGELFAPADGQDGGGAIVDGQPDPGAGWYRVRDGRPAIVGLPGYVMGVLE